jgi:Calcineurin-like phosphoesterase
MLVRAAADLHGHLPTVERCDVLLLAGDLVPLAVQDSDSGSQRWLRDVLGAWLEDVPAEHVVGIAGNHDLWAQHAAPPEGLRWTYLQDDGATVAGLRMWGTPWTPTFGGWAFEAEPEARRETFAHIPAETDVLLAHCPPWGCGDRAPRRGTPEAGSEHVGCPELLQAIELVLPTLVVFGHVHEDGGYRDELPSGPLLANVSILDGGYKPVRGPARFEL